MIHPVNEFMAQRALLDAASYQAMYRRSIEEPDRFWSEQAERFLDWGKRWERVCEADFAAGLVKWFDGGKLNACHNCLDRHLPQTGEPTRHHLGGRPPGRRRRNHLPRTPPSGLSAGQRP